MTVDEQLLAWDESDAEVFAQISDGMVTRCVVTYRGVLRQAADSAGPLDGWAIQPEETLNPIRTIALNLGLFRTASITTDPALGTVLIFKDFLGVEVSHVPYIRLSIVEPKMKLRSRRVEAAT